MSASTCPHQGGDCGWAKPCRGVTAGFGKSDYVLLLCPFSSLQKLWCDSHPLTGPALASGLSPRWPGPLPSGRAAHGDRSEPPGEALRAQAAGAACVQASPGRAPLGRCSRGGSTVATRI